MQKQVLCFQSHGSNYEVEHQLFAGYLQLSRYPNAGDYDAEGQGLKPIRYDWKNIQRESGDQENWVQILALDSYTYYGQVLWPLCLPVSPAG